MRRRLGGLDKNKILQVLKENVIEKPEYYANRTARVNPDAKQVQQPRKKMGEGLCRELTKDRHCRKVRPVKLAGT